MEVFEVVIALLLGGAALAAIARHVGAPYPALVALAGAGLALIPGTPTLVLDPELALALFVAPVLVDAAFDASARDMRVNWRPIASLALGAVALTIAVVAVVAKLLVPDMPWAAAIALGAIVAPPDAAAATTVLKQLRPPNRLLVILEGESLFNDASALLVYRLAVGATMSGFIAGWTVIPMLVGVTVGSVVLAWVLSRLSLLVIARISDVSTAVIVQFCGAFFVWILAEQLHLSGIITTVVFAMVASRRAAEIVPARLRIPSWAVWEVAVFVLNVLAFILVGFQLKSILARLTGTTGLAYAAFAAAVCAVVIVARIAWVTGAAAFSRWRCRPSVDGAPGPRDAVALDRRSAAVVGWCGMRGTVTLAAALALPADFPFRDLILTTAFGVTLGTLVLQGLTLRPLILRLGIKDDGAVEREVRLARVESLRAAVDAVAAGHGDESAELVRRRFALQLRRAEKEFATDGANVPRLTPEGAAPASSPAAEASSGDDDAAVIRAATAAQRHRLVGLRADGTIGDAAFQRVEEELDWAELGWSQIVTLGSRGDGKQ
ncbi:MAG TPA: sodium:proton antiporter [Gemmatimonadaceae bacterium]|nr:sodium:proton antiporter [Gemmatimonadaceae bacterium]